MKKRNLIIILFIVLIIFVVLGTILLVKNKNQNISFSGTSKESNLKKYATQYEIGLLPEKGTFIRIGDTIYNCSNILFSTTEIVKLTNEQIKDIPIIKSTDNASIISKENTQNSVYGYETSIFPIINLGKAIGITNSKNDSNKIQNVFSQELKGKGIKEGFMFSIKSNNAEYNELLEDIFVTNNEKVSISFLKDNTKIDLELSPSINYLRSFPRMDLDKSTIPNTTIVESKLPNNLPSGLYMTNSGLFYYQQENEEQAKQLTTIYQNYKEQLLEIINFKNTVEQKTKDNFGYLNLLIPNNTKIYELNNLKITGQETTTKQEVEANFSYGNTNLPSSKEDIFYANGEIYYCLRLTGGNIFDNATKWSSKICINYDTLKQLIEKGLDSNYEHNVHKTQKQSDVYNF